LILVACVLAMGCGGKATRVWGTVTFAGKPIPRGKIYFTPDQSKSNTGAPGYADIKDGNFDTGAQGGQAAPAGAVIVRIEGFEEIAPVGDITTKPLFFPYETPADLPKGRSSQTFDVPATAVKQPAKKAGKGEAVTP